MNIRKNERGITLIALAVTIIVMLILAGVTIATLTSENGIINQATKAKETNELGKVEEEAKLEYSNLILEKQMDGHVEDDATLTEVAIKLKELGYKVVKNNGKYYVKVNSGYYEVKLEDD